MAIAPNPQLRNRIRKVLLHVDALLQLAAETPAEPHVTANLVRAQAALREATVAAAAPPPPRRRDAAGRRPLPPEDLIV